jgi:hypothetical protein
MKEDMEPFVIFFYSAKVLSLKSVAPSYLTAYSYDNLYNTASSDSTYNNNDDDNSLKEEGDEPPVQPTTDAKITIESGPHPSASYTEVPPNHTCKLFIFLLGFRFWMRS